MKKIFNTLLIFTMLFINIEIIKAATVEENIASLVTKYNTIEQNAFLNAHPVGTIFETTSSSLNTAAKVASTYGGKWEAYGTDKVLRGTTGTICTTDCGGNNTYTLTEANIPSHTHSISHTHTTPSTTITSSGAHTHSTTQTTTSTMSLTANNTTSKWYVRENWPGTNNALGSDKTTTSGVNYSGDYGIYGSGSNLFWQILYTNTHSHSVTGSVTIPSLSISSSGAHTHTVPAMTTNSQSTTTSGSYGKAASAITAVNVRDPYVTVYRYRRTG